MDIEDLLCATPKESFKEGDEYPIMEVVRKKMKHPTHKKMEYLSKMYPEDTLSLSHTQLSRLNRSRFGERGEYSTTVHFLMCGVSSQ